MAQQQSFFLYSQITTVKVLKAKLEYWLPGITIEASGPRQPVDNDIKTVESNSVCNHTVDKKNQTTA